MVKQVAFTAYMMCGSTILILQSPPIPPEYRLIIDVGKWAVWVSIAVAMWKMLKVANQFYQTFNYYMAEHRHVVNVSREVHPDHWEDFDSIIGTETTKMKAAKAGE